MDTKQHQIFLLLGASEQNYIIQHTLSVVGIAILTTDVTHTFQVM